MKDYSDPSVWAQYLRQRGLNFDSPPPPPELLEGLEYAEGALDSFSEEEDALRGIEVVDFHRMLKTWASAHCRNRARERTRLAQQARATLARNYN